MIRLTFLLAGCVAGADVGFEGLFKTTANVSRQCNTAKVPAGIEGDFVIAGPAVFEMGKYKFKAAVDAFGQFYKFEVGSGQVCFSSQTMLTKFWNQSVQANEVAPSMLFSDTEPPRRACPILEPMCDALGGNDNVMINSVRVGNRDLELTDAATATNVDWHSLSVLGAHTFKDTDVKFEHVLTTGSAHPIRVEDGYVAFVHEMPLAVGHHYLDLVKISDSDNGLTRTLLARMEADFGWYVHTFGLTANFAVVPLNVFMKIDASTMLHRSNMADSFTAKMDGIAVLDLKGGEQKPRIFQVDPFWHTHISNSYEKADGSIVIDIVTFTDNMFNGPMTMFDGLMNKTARDNNPNRGVLKRFTLYKDGTTSTSVLSNPHRQFDFVKINQRYQSKPYCYVYGTEYWHDDSSVYSIGVGKLNVCSDSNPVTYWHRENWFPSEALFVEREGATAEDDGYLLFAALNGETQRSHFVIVNAKDMVEISNTEFDGRAAFTVHAQFLTKTAAPLVV
jgi:carotenoid cleavage dioxygenase-like enzyme